MSAQLDYIFSTIYYITGTIGIPANVLLIYLILFKTPESLRVYRVLLLNAAITDLAFSFSTFMAQIRIIPCRWYFTYVSLGPAGKISAALSYEMYTLQLHSTFYTFLSFPLSFGFRYYVLIRPIPRIRHLIIVCLSLWSIAIVQHFMFHFSQMEPEKVRALLHEYKPQYNLTGLVITGNKHMLEFPLVTIVLNTIILPMFPIYCLVVYFYKKIHFFLTEHAKRMSNSTVVNHKKLLQALSIQASLPVLFVFPPISLYLAYHLELVQCEIVEYLVFAIFSFYPMASPLITIWYVRPYKAFIMRTVGKAARMSRMSVTNADAFDAQSHFRRTSTYVGSNSINPA